FAWTGYGKGPRRSSASSSRTSWPSAVPGPWSVREEREMALAARVTEADLSRLDVLIAQQEAAFLRRQRGSAALAERARRSLAGGVTSSWQISRPQPIWISHGAGSKVYDADGIEYVDLHNGYGVMAVGHAIPKIVQSGAARVTRGTHFAQPTEDAILVDENLAQRFGLPKWRFANSGTEATMD